MQRFTGNFRVNRFIGRNLALAALLIATATAGAVSRPATPTSAIGPGDCSSPGTMTVYADWNFQGSSEYIAVFDIPDMRSRGIGNDTISSLVITNGCVTLYRDVNYQGLCQVFPRKIGDHLETRVKDMTYTAVGNDQVSSIKLGASDWNCITSR